MKKYLLFVSVIVLSLTACESNKETPYLEIVFKIGQDLNHGLRKSSCFKPVEESGWAIYRQIKRLLFSNHKELMFPRQISNQLKTKQNGTTYFY